MSRIHEALKKAEKERMAQPSPVAEAMAATQVIEVAPTAPPRLQEAPRMPEPMRAPTVAAMPIQRNGGSAEDLSSRWASVAWKPDPKQCLFVSQEPDPSATEQFRSLRSRLYQIREIQKLQTILITSAVPAEGKTFVAANLAHAFMRQQDRRVLLIDADLRCSRLHQLLGAPTAPGLAEYLHGEADETSIVQRGPSGLCFIPGGNPSAHPSELISNGRFKALLERLGPLFDWILVDSPPMAPGADASVMAGLTDGVLFVLRAGSTPSEVVTKAKQGLEGRNVVGVVLNRVERSGSYGSYYYYGHYNENGKNGKP